MSSTYSLALLDENTLADISELSGASGLSNLLQTGNELLRLKLCNNVRFFQSIHTKSKPNELNFNFLSRLKRLQRISIFGAHRLSPRSLLPVLPATIVYIRLEMRNAVTLCYDDTEEDIDNPLGSPFNLSLRFPDLHTLILTGVPDPTDDDDAELIDTWFTNFLPILPPRLTSLHISCVILVSNLLEDLPRTLQSLSFAAPSVRGFSWISGLNDLTELSISILPSWVVPTSEMEGGLTPHPSLQKLQVSDLQDIVPWDSDLPKQEATALFYAFIANVEHLEAPELDTPIEICSNWKGHFLAISSARGAKTSIKPLMSTNITYLTLSSSAGDWLPVLPTFLRYLSLPETVLSSEDCSILPRTLTALSVYIIRNNFSDFGPNLPPSLTYLNATLGCDQAWLYNTAALRIVDQLMSQGENIEECFWKNISASHEFGVFHSLNLLPKALRYAELSDDATEKWAFFRHPDPSKSIGGWTTLTLAAALGDFDTLERIANGDCVPSLGLHPAPVAPLRPHSVDFSELIHKTWVAQIPLKTLQWMDIVDFQNRHIAAEFYASCISSKFVPQIEWGLKHITPKLWNTKGPYLIDALPVPRQLPMVEYMANERGMQIDSSKIALVQRLAILAQNSSLIFWLHDRGYHEIYIDHLQPHCVGRARPYANIGFLKQLAEDGRVEFQVCEAHIQWCMNAVFDVRKKMSFSQRMLSVEYAEWILPKFGRNCLPPEELARMENSIKQYKALMNRS